MTKLKESRFENGRPMLFAGIRRHHAFASVGDGITRQWRDFEKLGTLPGQVGTTAYGAICGADTKAQTIEYMCAFEVASFEGLPKELGRMRVPAARYAVFRHDGNVATVRATWDRIFKEWLPSSGFRSNETPDFEVYGERFDPQTGDGGIEIWVGIAGDAQ
ncbi:MAG TPA: GyrI-like domain-containing protein [Gammaproteobacteria bacterium]